jgi:hypothetical protein
VRTFPARDTADGGTHLSIFSRITGILTKIAWAIVARTAVVQLAGRIAKWIAVYAKGENDVPFVTAEARSIRTRKFFSQ